MNTYPLGWQSWSPLQQNIFKLPHWDYCPCQPLYFTKKSTITPQKPKVSLWCSWHANGKNINEKLILNQADKFKNHKYIPEYILIDDGWCNWGDWQSPLPDKFPSWKQSLSNLKKLNYKTGLWISPFLVDPKSIIFKLHSDWIIKSNGKPLNAFASYPLLSALTPKYLLDFTNPEVINYLYSCIDKMVIDWGISLLKIDHLYAPYFANDPNLTALASQTIVNLFSYLRTKYPRVYVIACGCPFDVAEGLVDSIRISKDINSPQLNRIPILSYLFYLKRKKILRNKIQAALTQKFPIGIDPDAAINVADAAKYHNLWKSGKIQVFGLGYNL